MRIIKKNILRGKMVKLVSDLVLFQYFYASVARKIVVALVALRQLSGFKASLSLW